MEEEIWKPLVYHGEYFGDTHEISNLGRLRNIQLDKILHPSKTKKGYLMQVISRGRDRSIGIRIHRAVAENFVDGDKSLAVNHKDLDKTNNRWDNLEFITDYENTQHAVINGAMSHSLERGDLELIAQLRKEGKTFTEIGERLGVNRRTVSAFVHGQTHKYSQDLLEGLV